MKFHIVTLFPEAFESYLKSSILGRAVERGLVKIKFYHPRDYAKGKHKIVDDKPYAGGAGMVLMAEPVARASEAALKNIKKGGRAKIVFLSVGGRQFTNAAAIDFSKLSDVVIISGRYEGVDDRVVKILKDLAKKKKRVSVLEMSVGPFIVMGGELPAMMIVDSVSRHIEGVLGKRASLEEVRFKDIAKQLGKSIVSDKGKTPSLPVYTRPEVLKYKGKKYTVPKVLITGNHHKIAEWKAKNMKFA